MNVTLLAFTPDALDVLLYTKQTRLQMTAAGLAEVKAWPESRKMEELRYMRNTIQSSWEFVDYIFAIEGVTRAFTHQLVRHRVGTSFAQQAQRVVNMEGFRYLATGDLTSNGEPTQDCVTKRHGTEGRLSLASRYREGMNEINVVYEDLLAAGAKPQDARGILPTNILTNIVFKANLRTLHDMALKRLCVKAQGEFQDVFRSIVEVVTMVHPWTADFLKVQCAWNGTCLFPSLPVKDCHVKPHVYDPTHRMSYGQVEEGPDGPELLPLEALYQLHRSTRTEIQPTITQPEGWDGIK